MIRMNFRYIQLVGLAVAGLGTGVFSTTDAEAQSFSCARAQIPSELAICNNEDLIILDEQLADLFADRRITAKDGVQIQQISQKQGEWLRERNSCTLDFDCLQRQYKNRIRVLQTDQSL